MTHEEPQTPCAHVLCARAMDPQPIGHWCARSAGDLHSHALRLRLLQIVSHDSNRASPPTIGASPHDLSDRCCGITPTPTVHYRQL